MDLGNAGVYIVLYFGPSIAEINRVPWTVIIEISILCTHEEVYDSNGSSRSIQTQVS